MARWRIGRVAVPLALFAVLAGCNALPTNQSDDGNREGAPPGTEQAGDGAGSDVAEAPAPGGGAKRAVTDTQGAASAGVAMTADEMAAREASEGAPDGLQNMLSAQEADKAADLAVQAAFVQDVVASAVDRSAVLAGTSDTDLDAESPEGRVAALGERPSYRVLYSQRLAEKGATARAAEVGIYRYDTGEAIYAKVDLASGEVSALDAPTGAGLPLVREEIDEAATAARQDERVAGKLTAAGLDVAATHANGLLTRADEGPCAEHRCVRLFFGTVKAPLPTFSVVVDLVTLQVVDVADMPTDGGTAHSEGDVDASSAGGASGAGEAGASGGSDDAYPEPDAEPTADPMEGIQP